MIRCSVSTVGAFVPFTADSSAGFVSGFASVSSAWTAGANPPNKKTDPIKPINTELAP